MIYPPTGSTAYEREMSTAPIRSFGVWPSFIRDISGGREKTIEERCGEKVSFETRKEDSICLFRRGLH